MTQKQTMGPKTSWWRFDARLKQMPRWKLYLIVAITGVAGGIIVLLVNHGKTIIPGILKHILP